MGRLAYGVEKGLSQYSNPETLYQSLDSYSTLYPCRTQNPKPTLPLKAVVPNPASTFLKSFGDSPGCANAGGKGVLGLGFSPESRQYLGEASRPWCQYESWCSSSSRSSWSRWCSFTAWGSTTAKSVPKSHCAQYLGSKTLGSGVL